VIQAVDPDVRLVVVGGLPVYGDVDIMQAMDDDAEVIHGVGFSKAIDITYEGVPEAQQTYADMMEYLGQCNQGKTVPIEYLFTTGDERYFDVLNRSSTFQNGRSIDLWTMYYDVDLDEDGHRIGGTVGGADPIVTSINNDNGDGSQTVDPVQLPQIFETYGPLGATVAHPVEISRGIHLEACGSTSSTLLAEGVPSTPSGRELVCGAISIRTIPAEGCLATPDANFCSIAVGGAIAVPGQLCAELSMPAGVECRDAWSFFEPEGEPSEPGPATLEEEDSTISGPIYWIAVVGLLGLIISSLTVAVTNWNRRK